MSNGRKRKTSESDYAKELADRFSHWEQMYAHGGSDPFWPDGVNLNLVRNHILYYKRKLEEICNGSLPEIYHRETPPEVDPDYMARADEIRAAAEKSLAIYKADPHFRYCVTHVDSLTSKERARYPVIHAVRYVNALEQAIAQNDLVAMRRHENTELYLNSFAKCEQAIRQIKAEREQEPQLSLFFLLDADANGPEQDEEGPEPCESSGMTME